MESLHRESQSSTGESCHLPAGMRKHIPCPSAGVTELQSYRQKGLSEERVLFLATKKNLVQGFALAFAEGCEVPVEAPLVFEPLIPVW